MHEHLCPAFQRSTGPNTEHRGITGGGGARQSLSRRGRGPPSTGAGKARYQRPPDRTPCFTLQGDEQRPYGLDATISGSKVDASTASFHLERRRHGRQWDVAVFTVLKLFICLMRLHIVPPVGLASCDCRAAP